jgi:uncharacterized surface protein with fasciclin (FAS1) repeats
MKQTLALGLLFALAALPAAAGDCGSSRAVQANIVETATSAGSFTTLLAAAEAAGLDATLTGAGPYTVFAPTDEAFAKLPDGAVEALLADPDALREILLYHVVPGRVLSSQVIGLDSATTAQGSDVSFKVADNGVLVNDARVISPDIQASNGVIHVIDTVIMPTS